MIDRLSAEPWTPYGVSVVCVLLLLLVNVGQRSSKHLPWLSPIPALCGFRQIRFLDCLYLGPEQQTGGLHASDLLPPISSDGVNWA